MEKIPREAVLDALNDLADVSELLNNWELNFVRDLLEIEGEFTYGQTKKVTEIWQQLHS